MQTDNNKQQTTEDISKSRPLIRGKQLTTILIVLNVYFEWQDLTD